MNAATATSLSFKDKLSQFQQQANDALVNCLPAKNNHPNRLHEAIHYAVMIGGKRVRPALVYATARLRDNIKLH